MPYHFVYPPGLRDWAPLDSLRQWLKDELDLSDKALKALRAPAARKRERTRS